MPRTSRCLRSKAYDFVIPLSVSPLTFLIPALYERPLSLTIQSRSTRSYSNFPPRCQCLDRQGQDKRRCYYSINQKTRCKSVSGRLWNEHQRYFTHGRKANRTTDDLDQVSTSKFFDQHIQTSELARHSQDDFSKISNSSHVKLRDEDYIVEHEKVKSKTPDNEPEILPRLEEARARFLSTLQDLESKINQIKKEQRSSISEELKLVNTQQMSSTTDQKSNTEKLSKENYVNLVDLYYYTNKSRFSPESPDSSPTPQIIENDYSFKLSEETKANDPSAIPRDTEDPPESPLLQIEEMLKSRQLREIFLTQKLIDLLLDDKSSNRALFEIYKQLPEPGVAYIPRSVIRLLLQRMSTPWVKSERSMLRYLSLIDDMQRARLPITRSEWSSAIYLAGRSFSKVSEENLASAFHLWRKMEQEAHVTASHVTFNILFDIAVRAGKLVMAESLLKEMHTRGLRLNRYGRVSLIYYHGLRGDGDGVRKTYRDFIDAGEIVDTIVLNCVIASLLNAQEPSAAEQVYERMKSLQERLKNGPQASEDELLFNRYPSIEPAVLEHDFASNSLGRVLLRASRIRDLLPQHHAALQRKMPLTPDHVTFRSMISYHSTTSGNLDRIAVLMNEMTETFNLPFQAIHFQLLFKGFALHGASKDPDAMWSQKRLDMVWDACRNVIKGGYAKKSVNKAQNEIFDLPTIKEVNTFVEEDPRQKSINRPSKRKKSEGWYNFILDLGGKNGEEEESSKFSDPFFPKGERQHDPDQEEKYDLPSPIESVEVYDQKQIQAIRPTRQMIIWLLRAYTRCTGSKLKVEEVWNSIRKIWNPQDISEKDHVVRVLRRCLHDCQRFGPPFL